MLTTASAFKRARSHAVQHMAACEKAQLTWSEAAISEIVISRAAAAVTAVPFTQRAEAISGADWVWWWLDGRSAYGMLVQAKRVTIKGGRWSFDFGYPKRTGRQRSNLGSTATSLGLVPVYALYLGSGKYRNWEQCPDGHQRRNCPACVKRSISLMPALLADAAVVTDSTSTYARSAALEDINTPSSTGASLIPALRERLAPDLADFLLSPQSGARAVTRSMIDRVLRVRMGQFGAVRAQALSVVDGGGNHDRLGPVFPELPSDTDHSGTRYFEEVLNPLRRVPPDYVLDIESGVFDADELASNMPDEVAGIVVVRLSQNG